MKPLLIASFFLAFLGLFSFVPSVSSESIEVFLVTHSHDDVGWIMPWERYYTQRVRSILDSVIDALENHPDRKFTQVEVAFFRRWWQEISPTQQARTRKIIANNQIEFNIGGITMNDESTPTYAQEINQMTNGADWLFQTLGVRARSNWHVDPFGHSKATASLWSQMGFPAWGLNRIPYYIKDRMKAQKGLEFVWRGSDTLGSQSEIFAHVLDSFYITPGEMTLNSDNFDVVAQAKSAVDMIKTRSTWFRHNKLLIPFGNDFDHQQAGVDYDRMDKLINYINQNEATFGVKVHYSFLSEYVEAVHKLNITWDVFEGDFFPYNDGPDSFWSGYYTSRPWFKQFLRESDAFLASTEILMTQSGLNSTDLKKLDRRVDELRMATSRATHHDAVSGTETTETNNDYVASLKDGISSANLVVQKIVQKLSNGNSKLPQNSVRYAVQNPLGWRRKEVISILTDSSSSIVTDVNGGKVQSQTNPVPNYSKVGSRYRLYFYVDIPALSTGFYNVQFNNGSMEKSVKISKVGKEISNGKISITFDKVTGKLATIENVQEKKKANATFDFLQYLSAIPDMGQSSGAYIFRPITDTLWNLGSSDQKKNLLEVNLYRKHSDNPFAFAVAYSGGNYLDSTSITLNKLRSQRFQVAVSRIDSDAGWGDFVTVDYNVFDEFPLKDSFGVNYALGKFSVGKSNSIRVEFNSASKSRNGGKFNKPPVVILTVQTESDLYIVASLSNVDANGFNANLAGVDSVFWDESDEVIINWMAMEEGSGQNGGEQFFRSGIVKIPANPAGNQYAQYVNHLPSTATGSAFFTVNGGSSNQNSVFVSNSNLRNATTFGAVVRKLNGGQTWSEMSLHYVILPRSAVLEQINDKVSHIIIDGPLVKEVQQTFAENYVQTLVLYNVAGTQSNYVQIINEVGPLNTQGKELVTRLSTDLKTEGVLYTDDNGLEVVKRKFDITSEELQAGNYFPMIQRSFLRDESTQTQVVLLSDSTHGVASLNPGQMEVMLHRRCMVDDGRGVSEPLNDVDPIRPSLWLSISGYDQGSYVSRYVSILQQYPLQAIPVGFGGGSNIYSKVSSLPENVNLLTFRNFNGATLVRLQHIFAKGEHSTLSKASTVDLQRLFPNSKIASVSEMNLNANTPYDEMIKNRLQWKTTLGPNPQVPIPINGNVVTIQPMEIRTFVVKTN